MLKPIFAVAVVAVALIVVACGGGSSGLDAIAKSCEQAGGTWRGAEAKAHEACAVRYADGTHFLQVDFGADKVITTGDRRDCLEPEASWREQLHNRSLAAQLSAHKRTRQSARYHADTGMCEKTQARVTAGERRLIAFSRYADQAETALCNGLGPRARDLAERALHLRDDRQVRRVIADSHTLDQEQAANRANPAGAPTPAILVKRCGAAPDVSSAAGDKDCSDFDTQSQAQAYFDGQVGDRDRLDADDDGVACNWLP